MKCIYCQSSELSSNDLFLSFRTVSSDAKPWKRGFTMVTCKNCGFPQAAVTPEWNKSSAEIYSEYESYYQTSDLDQVVFTEGIRSWRADLFMSTVLETANTELGGKVLDFGCGAGNLLRTISRVRKDLELYGFDLDDREYKNFSGINNFKKLFVESLNTDLTFDLILMSHSLEHLSNPEETLLRLRGLLSSRGYLAIAVPDCSIDPIKLLVADHCSHFSVKTLKIFLENSGFEVVQIESTLATRECWAICKPSETKSRRLLSSTDTEWVVKSINWIETVRTHAAELAKGGAFGIFGTSINALWLFGEIELDVDFFVDEDVARLGTKLFGRPVISPSQVTAGSTVYLPFVSVLAEKIATRLSSLDVCWAVPFKGP